jgi:2-amino-4-hydroxy-6-hydroxymethyldihydropteridine diphosphokinase
LLLVLLGIERSLGRQRTIRNGPRTIDLDILIYGDEKINEPDLKIPHPRMREREFVQRPLRDIYESV